jgi:hypothetical protein
MRRLWPAVLLLALGHYLLTSMLLYYAMSASYDYFDNGTLPGGRELIAGQLVNVLMFPGYPISERIGLGWLAPVHALLQLLTHLLWGAGICLLGVWASGPFRRKTDLG